MKISKLQPSRRKKGRWLVCLEDGTLIRVGESEVLSFSLFTGKELDGEELAALTAAGERMAVEQKLVNRLIARPMSRREVQRYVTEKGGTEESAAQLCDRLEALGLVNDEALAAAVAEHCFAKGYGAARVKSELVRRGIPRQFWDEVLRREDDETDAALDRFVASALRGREPTPKELQRVSAAIVRRGFTWQQARDALNRFGAEIDPAE